MNEKLHSSTTNIDEKRQGEVFSSAKSGAGNGKRKYYLETYGCQMNFSDSEIVASILNKEGYESVSDYKEAEMIFVNTCAIRENAEQTVRNRLNELRSIKKKKPNAIIGLLGCMAERLKHKLLEEEKLIDIVIGPDAYRELPNLITQVDGGQAAINVLLSREETYADISPVRLDTNGVTAFISIMRGCDNMCSFCVVPFTRGRERSRDMHSIIKEARELFNNGYREVTLLGQNVDSYKWKDKKTGQLVTFTYLLEQVAKVSPLLRIRFSTSHPKDMVDEVLHTIAKYDNICNYIHLPVQSGSSVILKRMNRTYDRNWYKERIESIKRIIPGCGISTDTISGFCGETQEDHNETLSMMNWVEYDMAYMFKYSERPGTLAQKKYKDDIPEAVKSERLNEIISLQLEHSYKRNQMDINKVHRVLVEGVSKRSENELYGRNDQNKVVIFPREKYSSGDYVNIMVNRCTSATLFGKVVA
ncbi:MAG: tRNA (N6-isopentenyl adenosine(37)-C2)-methylthiotransferase MiaB [Bacteroidetes bacterium]|nr:tRNA (N6-isopentenyl adenosine(37)-C2)-methylthiotransferase MiaB [Bacteroidota bacterium]